MAQVQILFDQGGEHAAAVQDWLASAFGHMRPACSAMPGLSVTATLPSQQDGPDNGEHWWNRPEAQLVKWTGALGPTDVLMEILAQCFEELRLPQLRIVAVHLTAA